MAEKTDEFGKLEQPEGTAPIKDVSDKVAKLERSNVDTLSVGGAVLSSYSTNYLKSDISQTTYERMMTRSPIFRGARNKFYESIVADRPNITYTGDNEKKGELMKKYLNFAFPEKKLNAFIWNILAAIFYGFSVAEYCYQGRQFDGREVITPPTWKPNLVKFLRQGYIDFHLDNSGNLIVNHRSPNVRDKTHYKAEHGISYSYNHVSIGTKYYLSPNKALITTYGSDSENLFGNGLLRAAYEPWYILDKLLMSWSVNVERNAVPSKIFLGKESDQVQTFANNASRGIHQHYFGDKETFDVKILESKYSGTNFKMLLDDLKFYIYFALGLPTTGISSRMSADSAATEYDEYSRTKKQAFRLFVEDNVNRMYEHYLKINFNIEEGEPIPFLRYPPVIKGDIGKYSDAVLKLRTIGIINDNDYDNLRWYYFGLENMDGEPDPLVIDNKTPDSSDSKSESMIKLDADANKIKLELPNVIKII